MKVVIPRTLVVWRWGFVLRLACVDIAFGCGGRKVKCSINLV